MSNLEFHIDGVGPDGTTLILTNWGEAVKQAALKAASRMTTIRIDVVTWDRAAAVSWAGEDGGEQYDEDPEASVFERIEVRVNSLGRVA